MQFRLRSLFATVLISAIFFSISRTAGFAVAGGILVSLIAIAWAIRCQRRGAMLYIRWTTAIAALVAIWFLAVDWSWFVGGGDCPDCKVGRFVDQYRVFGLPIKTTIDDDFSLIALTARDLGIPCSHPNLSFWQKERWWGLVYCRCPCWQGTIRLVNITDRYTTAVSAKMKTLGASDPDFVATFRDRVLHRHDFAYFDQWFGQFVSQPTDTTE